jgi:hypothetical protein
MIYLAWRIYGVFITHKSYYFMVRRGLSVILPLWYFELYFTQNNTYLINIKYRETRIESWENTQGVLGADSLELYFTQNTWGVLGEKIRLDPSLWYFELYFTQNNTYLINIKYQETRIESRENTQGVLGADPLKMRNGSRHAVWTQACWAWGALPNSSPWGSCIEVQAHEGVGHVMSMPKPTLIRSIAILWARDTKPEPNGCFYYTYFGAIFRSIFRRFFWSILFVSINKLKN